MPQPVASAAPHRIAVIGPSGAGKTTLALQLAAIYNTPLIELDTIFWGPGWTPTPRDQFRAHVAVALAGRAWVVDGNYSSARDLIWGRAKTLVWLDYGLPLVLWRLLRRSVTRIVSGEDLAHGNRETWRSQFLSRESLLFDALRRHANRRRAFLDAIQRAPSDPAFAHLAVLRLRGPRATAAFVRQIRACANHAA